MAKVCNINYTFCSTFFKMKAFATFGKKCTFVCVLHDYLAVAERPQHMLMRVAIGIHGEDIDAAIEVNSFEIYSPLSCVVTNNYPRKLNVDALDQITVSDSLAFGFK